MKQDGREEKKVERESIIVAIPNYWLRLPALDLLQTQRLEYLCVENLSELYRLSKDSSGVIVVVDAFAYEEEPQVILDKLQKILPVHSILLLLPEEALSYVSKSSQNVFPVAYEKMLEDLIPVLKQELLHQKQLPTLKKEVKELRKENGNIFEKKFGRRSFLKGSAAAAAVAGVAVANPVGTVKKALAAGDEVQQEVASGDKIFHGSCRTSCPSSCALKIIVRDGKIVRTTAADMPNPEYNRVCVKGLSYAQYHYSQTRLKYPLKRVGERGSGQWEQIGWDEAIQTICSNFTEIQGKYGNSSIGVFTGGSLGHCGIWSQLKLISLLGATNLDNCYDRALAYAANQAIGTSPFWFGNEYVDLKNAKTIICWGANATDALQQNWHFYADAMEKGAKLIVIDPIYTTTASKADMFVPIRPATDAALAMAMLNVIIKEGLTDQDFMKKHTVAPFLVKESDGKFLRQSDLTGVPVEKGGDDPFIVWNSLTNTHGLVTEVEDPAIIGDFLIEEIKVTTAYDLLLKRIALYTPEYSAEICGISADMIRDIARIYATDTPSTITFGLGVDHYANSHGAYKAMHTLGMVTGNVGRPGASVGQGCSSPGFINNAAIFTPPPGVTPGPTIPSFLVPEIQKTGQYKGEPFQLKAYAILGGNPFANLTDRKAWIESLKDVEFIMSTNIEMGDSTLYSDIVLPAAFIFESDDMHYTNVMTPYMYLQEKAVEPPYECKSDFEINQLIAKGMGLGQYFDYTPEEWMKEGLNTDAARALGITWEKLKKEKIIRQLPDGPEGVFLHAEGGKFPTPTGRGEFYVENPVPRRDYGQEIDVEKEHLPFFELPVEAWPETVGALSKNKLADKYPLIYFQGSQRFRTHTMFSHIKWLRELDPEPIIRISEKDALARGIQNGDIVKVYNDRGYVVVKAVIHNGIPSGMVNMDRGWQKHQFIEGHYTDLTHRQSNPACPNNNYYDVLCQIEKI